MVQPFLLIRIPDSYNHYVTINPVATKHMPHTQHVCKLLWMFKTFRLLKRWISASAACCQHVSVTQKKRYWQAQRRREKSLQKKVDFPDVKESQKDRQSWPYALAWDGKKAQKSRHGKRPLTKGCSGPWAVWGSGPATIRPIASRRAQPLRVTIPEPAP